MERTEDDVARFMGGRDVEDVDLGIVLRPPGVIPTATYLPS